MGAPNVRGLFLKIFVFFWLAQSIIVLLSAVLIVRQRYEKSDAVFDALFSMLQTQGDYALRAYEIGGCTGLMDYRQAQDQRFQLADSTMNPVCGEPAEHNYKPLLTRYHRMVVEVINQMHRFGAQVDSDYIWTVPVWSSKGDQYFFFLLRKRDAAEMGWFHDLADLAYPQFAVAIIVCGLTTLGLGLLVTRPISKLRIAAHSLSEGKLESRVAWTPPRASIFRGDEIQGLVNDFNFMAGRLESLVNAHRLLLRDVSHELRSPLARLTLALDFAEDDATEEMKPHLARMEKETGRLNALVSQLLTLSHLDSMDHIVDASEFTLNGIIEDILPDAQFEARKRQCALTFSSNAECTLVGHPELIFRACENIIRNAIRYTSPGTTVNISLLCETRQGEDVAILEVLDRGPGIPPDLLAEIFLPFYRVDAARQSETGGVGVGLAIADRAVRLHHGNLQALNRDGGGAILRMTLPCTRIEYHDGIFESPASV